MHIELVTMLPGDEDPIDRWDLQLTASNEQQAFAAQWEKLSRKIVEEQSRSYHVQPEIFLCLREPEIGSNYARLLELFDTAHRYIRGAPLYLVISSTIGQAGTLVEEPRTLNRWFEVVERNVTDLIQFQLPHYQQRQSVQADKLSQKTDESRHRQTFLEWLLHEESLRKLETGQPRWPWRQISLPIRTENHQLWSEFSVEQDSQNFNLAFIVGPDGQSPTLLEDELKGIQSNYQHKKRQPRQIVIPWVEKLAPEFEEFCVTQDLTIMPVFSWPCEIRFCLQRLNQHSMADTSAEVAVRAVLRKPENEIFAPYEITNRPALLLTSTFHHSDPGHFSASRQEISEVVRLAWQGSTRPTTHNAVNVKRLHEVLSSASTPLNLTVWLHLGHGEKIGGLREYDNSLRQAADWLACFSGLPERRSLALVVFSACHSIEIAQRFAEAGVGVAIGFENKVDQTTCQQISVPVIHAAWKTNGDPVAILDAFKRTLAAATLGIKRARPLAFHS